jgi:hypothetical protein
MELRDGKNQVPIFAPNDVTPFQVEPLEVGNAPVFIVLGMRMVMKEWTKIYRLYSTIRKTQP